MSLIHAHNLNIEYIIEYSSIKFEITIKNAMKKKNLLIISYINKNAEKKNYQKYSVIKNKN